MRWTQERQADYRTFIRDYIAGYEERIDCADLAIAGLADFAALKALPIKLKYYNRGWKWINFSPGVNDGEAYKNRAMMMLGALNIIDNTSPVPVASTQPGDFIMSRWSSTLGHTRVIYSVEPIGEDAKIVWYQGNLPPVVPERREDLFSNIEFVYEGLPRRWKFEQFG